MSEARADATEIPEVAWPLQSSPGPGVRVNESMDRVPRGDQSIIICNRGRHIRGQRKRRNQMCSVASSNVDGGNEGGS